MDEQAAFERRLKKQPDYFQRRVGVLQRKIRELTASLENISAPVVFATPAYYEDHGICHSLPDGARLHLLLGRAGEPEKIRGRRIHIYLKTDLDGNRALVFQADGEVMIKPMASNSFDVILQPR